VAGEALVSMSVALWEVLVVGPESRGHNPASRHHSGAVLAVAVAVCRDQHSRYSQLVSQKRSHAYTRPTCGWLLNRWTS